MAPQRNLDLTQAIAGCGRFQVFLIVIVQFITANCVWGLLIMTFGNFNPGWTCLDAEIDAALVLNYSAASPGMTTGLPLKMDNLNITQWSFDCPLKKNCKNFIYNLESSTVVTEWDLSCDLSWVPSIIISIEMTGAFIGCCLSGQIGDKFGRKANIYGHLGLYTIFNILATSSVSWQMYTSVLFFVGISVGGLVTQSFPFGLEFVNGWWRGVIVSIPVWSVGFIIFTLTVWLLRNWWQLHVVAAAVSALAFLTIFWTPESARWLTVTGKVDEAKEVIYRIARINKHPTPDTRIIDEIADDEKIRMGDHTYTYLDLFRITSLRMNTIKLGIIWWSMALAYYGVTFGTKALSGNFFINLFLSSILEFPGVMVVAPAVNHLGRRKSALIFFSVVVVGCFILVLMSFVASGKVRDISVLVMALFCKMSVVGVWSMFILYTSEIVPTVVRSINFGYLNAVARLGAIVSPFIIPNDPDKIYVGYIVIGILGILSCVLIWSLPETKGVVLKDTTHEAAMEDKLQANTERGDKDQWIAEKV